MSRCLSCGDSHSVSWNGCPKVQIDGLQAEIASLKAQRDAYREVAIKYIDNGDKANPEFVDEEVKKLLSEPLEGTGIKGEKNGQ